MCEYVCEDMGLHAGGGTAGVRWHRKERVVRCRDCKFALVSKDAISCHGPIQAAGIAMCAGKLVKPDGFCSWGEGCER